MKYTSKFMCFALALQVSCGDEDEDGSGPSGGRGSTPPSGPFLEAIELEKPSNVSEMSSFQLSSFLASRYSEFKANYSDPDDRESLGVASIVNLLDDSEAIDESCFADQMEQAKINATTDKLVLSIAFNSAACDAPVVDGLVFDLTFAMYHEILCKDENLSAYDGIGFDEFEAIDNVCPSGGSYLNHSFFEVEISISGEGVFISNTSKIASSQSTEAGNHCEIENSGDVFGFANACVHVEVSEESSRFTFEGETEAENKRNYFKYTMRPGVTWTESDEDSWYTTGTVPVVVNDWAGLLTFDGPNTSPSYRMTFGSEVVNGTLTSGGASLREVRKLDRISQLRQNALQFVAQKKAELQK